MKRLLIVSAVLGSAFLAPVSAEACSGLSCDEGVFALHPDPSRMALVTLPKNAPALFVSPEKLWAKQTTRPFDRSHVRLLDPAGKPVPFVLKPAPPLPVVLDYRLGPHEGYFVVPDAPFVAGLYTLEYEGTCTRPRGQTTTGVIREPQWAKSHFVAGPAAPLPTQAGTLEVSESQMVDSYSNSTAGWCEISRNLAAIVRLNLTPSAELEPFLPIARASVFVDGQRWTTSDFGKMRGLHSEYEIERSALTLHALCGPPSPSLYSWAADKGVAEGEHTVSMVIELAGGRQLPPLTKRFSIKCGGDPLPISDAGVGVGTTGGGMADAGMADAGMSIERQPSNSGGCALAGGAGGPSRFVALLLLMALLRPAMKRVRRRQRNRCGRALGSLPIGRDS